MRAGKGKEEQKDEPMPGWVIGFIVVGCVASLAITAIAIKLLSSENKHFLDQLDWFSIDCWETKTKAILLFD